MKAINRHYAASALAALLAVGAIGYAVQVRSEDTAAPAAAQSPAARHEARFTRLDADGDGIITRAEAEKDAPGMARRFEQFDTNKDGSITRDEWNAAHQAWAGRGAGPMGGKGPGRMDPQAMQQRAEERFARLDNNGDGLLSKDEVQQRPGLASRFDQLDANKDGAIGTDEWGRGHQAMMEQYRARREQCRQDPQGCRVQMQERAQARFSQADLNGDGALSRDEAEKGVPGIARHFDRLDANQDGQVTPDELRAARKARHERRMEQRQGHRSSLQM